MANVVCIDEATVRVGICEIDDIVSIHDDDVELCASFRPKRINK